MKKIAVLILFCITYLFAYDATIEISKSKNKLYKIMVEDSSEIGTFSQRFHKMLIGDLEASANFNVIEYYSKNPFDSTPLTPAVLEKSAELLLRFQLTNRDGVLEAKVKLFNIKSGATLYERVYTILEQNKYPFLSHKIIVDLNNEMGNPSIDWMNKKVVFAKYTTPGKSVIIVSDYTLTYQKVVISGGLNIFPKWANEKDEAFYYTKYVNRLPTLYKYNIHTGEKEKIITSNGMLVCSDVSRDGKKLILTMAPHDQPDIYEYNLVTKRKKRLTKFSGIDVSGQYVDNDKNIVFVSDRIGYPNIFLRDSSGNIEQLVYHGKNNSSCSTNGNYIVYSSREASKDENGFSVFNLYLISTKTEYIRKLTSYGKNSFPRFAKNSDTILFIKTYKNQSALGLIRLNANYSVSFPLKVGKIQSIDW